MSAIKERTSHFVGEGGEVHDAVGAALQNVSQSLCFCERTTKNLCFQDMSMNFSCTLIQKGLGFLACDNAEDKTHGDLLPSCNRNITKKKKKKGIIQLQPGLPVCNFHAGLNTPNSLVQ